MKSIDLKMSLYNTTEKAVRKKLQRIQTVNVNSFKSVSILRR